MATTHERVAIRHGRATEPQREFWRSGAQYRALIGGVGSGKSRAGAVEVFRQPSGTTGMICAPSWKMLRRATLDTFVRMAKHSGLLVSHHRTEHRIELVGERVIYYGVTTDPDSLRGPNLGWFWLDEADYVTADAVKVMLGRLRVEPSRAWFTTSPNPFGWLRAASDMLKDLHVVKAPTGSNPFNAPGFADRLREQYGEVLARQEVDGEYLDQVFDQLIPEPWLVRATEAKRPEGGLGPKRLAADLCAGVGRDRFALVVADDAGLIHFEQSSRVGVPEAALRMREAARRWGVAPERCIYDGAGIGADMPHYLEDFGFHGPRPYFGGAHGTSEQFTNNRSRYAWSLRRRLDPSRVVLDPAKKLSPEAESLIRTGSPIARGWKAESFDRQPAWSIPPALLGHDNHKRLCEELSGMRFHVMAKQTRLEPKEDFAARLGRSPDLADALIMWEAA